MTMQKETVTLTIQVPKGVIDFLKDLFAFDGCENDISDFIEGEVAGIPESILGSLPNTWFDMNYIRKKYHLQE